MNTSIDKTMKHRFLLPPRPQVNPDYLCQLGGPGISTDVFGDRKSGRMTAC